MSAISSSNYMSDSAILAWVAEQQGRLYGDLREAMSFEEMRAAMASDVSDLNALLQKSGEDTKHLPALGVALDEFEQKYGDIPEFQEVTDIVDQIRSDQSTNIRKATGLTAVEAAAIDPTAQFGVGANGAPLQASPTLAGASMFSNLIDAPQTLSKESVDTWVENLGKKIDASNTNQQIGMIRIGELKSTIDQGSNLASQLVKSGNDTTSSIINNF